MFPLYLVVSWILITQESILKISYNAYSKFIYLTRNISKSHKLRHCNHKIGKTEKNLTPGTKIPKFWDLTLFTAIKSTLPLSTNNPT